MKINIHKVQCVLPEQYTEADLKDLDIIITEKRGRLLTLTIRGSEDLINAAIKQLDPIFYEMVPLTLEEIFISETEVKGYDIKKLIPVSYTHLRKYAIGTTSDYDIFLMNTFFEMHLHQASPPSSSFLGFL